MAFSGSGGPPPKMAREQGLNTNKRPFGFRLFERLPSGKSKQIQFITLDQDRASKVGEKDVKILILDEAPPGGDEWQPSVLLHERFRYGNSWDNYIVCRNKTPEGCPVDVALREDHKHAAWCKDDCNREGKPENRRGKWRWVATGIKMKPYKIKSGPNAGKVIPFTRGLILAPEDQYGDFLVYRKAWGGLRGRIFNVSRNDGAFSSRIGDKWDPVEHWTDEKMMSFFRDAAAEYGLPVEDYVRPFDYASVLALPTVEKATEAAQWIATERGFDLNNPDSGANSAAGQQRQQQQQSNNDGGEQDEADIPF